MKLWHLLSLIVLLFAALMGVNLALGVGGWGPTNTLTIKVNRLYVDRSEKDSHYMVGSDKGVFEVNNGLLLGVWNADEVYSQLKEGKTYSITTEGNKVVNFFMQEYPYIVKVTEVLVEPIEEKK